MWAFCWFGRAVQRTGVSFLMASSVHCLPKPCQFLGGCCHIACIHEVHTASFPGIEPPRLTLFTSLSFLIYVASDYKTLLLRHSFSEGYPDCHWAAPASYLALSCPTLCILLAISKQIPSPDSKCLFPASLQFPDAPWEVTDSSLMSLSASE